MQFVFIRASFMSVTLKLIISFFIIILLFPATNALANHERGDRYSDRSYNKPYRPLGLYLGGGFGFGGNEVGRFSDGNGEIEKVRGGGGLLLEGGLLFAVDAATGYLRATPF